MNSILIIDDEEDVREAVKDILEIDGWFVETAPDGESGLNCLSEKKPSLVICDITMPGISGLETLNRIRKSGLSTAVVMLTAHDDKEKIIEALQLGAIDYVVKPFSPDMLRTKVANWLEIGRRMKEISTPEDAISSETLARQLRMIELFRLSNYKISKG